MAQRLSQNCAPAFRQRERSGKDSEKKSEGVPGLAEHALVYRFWPLT
jgi:hypothetical protein